MTENDLEKLYLETKDGIFTPIFEYKEYVSNVETGEYEYIGLVITKTAQEVYDEWLYNKENPPQGKPTPEDKITLLEEQLALQEESTLDIDYRVTCIELGI